MPRKRQDVPLATNLLRREGVYYFRARVPLDLVQEFGRAEVWRSLRTKEPREAKRLLPGAQAQFHAECDAKRQAMAPAPVTIATKKLTLTDDDLRRFAQEFYAWELERDAEDRRNGYGGNSTREVLRGIGAVDLNGGLVRDALAFGLEEGRIQVSDYADAICEREGIPRQGPAYDRLCQVLLRAKVEAMHRGRERDAGDFSGKPGDELLATPAKVRGAAPSTDDPEGEALATLCADYVAERGGSVSPEWRRAIKAALGEFQEFFGAERPLAAARKKDVSAYKAALGKIAAHASRQEKLSFKQLVQRGRKEGEEGLAVGSINRRLSALSKFGAWAVKQDHAEQNVFADLRLEKAQKTKRRPFNAEQLRRVFESSLFVGCASAKRGDEGREGTALVHDWRYWGMPLALFTGARLGEILQLRTEDVCEAEGAPCIRINDWAEEGGEASGKKVKNDASARLVPLHSTLIRMGFLEHVTRQREAGEARVFPGLKADNLGREATEPSKFFNRYLARIGVKKGPAIVFHSFRHTLIDGLRSARHPDPTIAGVVGHTKSDGFSMTGKYGERLPVPALTTATKAEIIASVDFAGLDLSHLIPNRRAKNALARSKQGSVAPAARSCSQTNTDSVISEGE